MVTSQEFFSCSRDVGLSVLSQKAERWSHICSDGRDLKWAKRELARSYMQEQGYEDTPIFAFPSSFWFLLRNKVIATTGLPELIPIHDNLLFLSF